MKQLLVVLLLLPARVVRSYSNVTLSSMDGDLSVTVYLPQSVAGDEEVFYESTRFEHGSMIGSIKLKNHELYGTELWRIPHNPGWTESGVGLASEFGVGDDGAFCNYKCGWNGVSDVSNGVLGYIEAKNGEPFLKIGVGALIKGSCYECDSSEDFKFNSPYAFSEQPEWTFAQNKKNEIVLQHEAVLHAKKSYGYRLKKEISLDENVLSVTSTLTNLGQDAFTTPWYSHHFFQCDGIPIGPGYSVDLGIKATVPQVFDEPSLWSWSTPLRDYAKIINNKGISQVTVQMKRQVDDGVRIKAEFESDDTSTGSFVLKGCETSIKEEIPEILDNNANLAMYAFNLYVERGTLSPEPQLLIHLDPGKSMSWTQRLEFNDMVSTTTPMLEGSIMEQPNTLFWSMSSNMNVVLLLFVTSLAVSALFHFLVMASRRLSAGYMPIPDGQTE